MKSFEKNMENFNNIEDREQWGNFMIDVSSNQSEMATKAVDYIIGYILKNSTKEQIKIGLPFGSDAGIFLKLLAERIKQENINISNVCFLETEEAFPMKHNNENAFSQQIQQTFIKPLKLSPDQYYLINSSLATVEDTMHKFKEKLEGVDVLVAGLNDSGAVYGLRAGQELKYENIDINRIKESDMPEGMKEGWKKMITEKFSDYPVEEIPTDFISLGFEPVDKAKVFIVIGSGPRKKSALEKIKKGLSMNVDVSFENKTKNLELRKHFEEEYPSTAEIINCRHRFEPNGDSQKTSIIFTDKQALPE